MLAGSATGSMPTGSMFPHKAGNIPHKNTVLRTHSLTIWSVAEKVNNKVHGRKEKEIFFFKKTACIFKESSWKMKTYNNKIDIFFLDKILGKRMREC